MRMHQEILRQGSNGADVAELHRRLAALGFPIDEEEVGGAHFGTATTGAVMEFQASHGLPANGVADGGVEASLAVALEACTYSVKGTVSSAVSAALGGLKVKLVDKQVGPDTELAQGVTAADGSFGFSGLVLAPRALAARHKKRPDLQALVSGSTGLLAASGIVYDAPLAVTLKVTLPPDAAGLASEYETLIESLRAAYPGRLSSLEGAALRQDITYLAQKTGWDARAIALAAMADALSDESASIAPAFFYALLRAGVSSDARTLFQMPTQRVKAIWAEAIAANVIPVALNTEAGAALHAFEGASAAYASAPGSILAQLLAPVLPAAEDVTKFAQLRAVHGTDAAGFETDLAKTFGEEKAKQLGFIGDLFSLVGRQAPVVTALLEVEKTEPLTSTGDLAARGYYDSEKWKPLIGSAVPAGFEDASQYAGLLAAQVRLAHPADVLATQVLQGVLPVQGAAGTAAAVHEFLTEHRDGFTLGSEPVEAYLKRQGVQGVPPVVVQQVKRLQRVYQMTPDDASMAVLLRNNVDSAYAITRYDASGFQRAFGAKLGGSDKASTIHSRAKQIFSAVLNTAVAYMTARSNLKLQSPSTVQAISPGADTGSSAPYATLEELFGSLDYCNCDDCGSILSPAAYLVDLLNYLDRPAPADGSLNPQEVLLARRPDLQYLPLTCENTNVALPYIDLVNETLEYFVANGLSLKSYEGYSTPDGTTSAELLASPQYVNDAAYTTLQSSYFPAPLPFNRPLEMLRQQFAGLGASLPALMATLRSDDRIDNRTSPLSYGWRDILLEQSGISRNEYALFQDPQVQLGDLYGLPNGTALAELQAMNLQVFHRRLGVSYSDLAAILQTRFINQHADLIELLQALQLPFTTLAELKAGTLSVDDFVALLPAGLDPTKYGGKTPPNLKDVAAWVTGDAYALLMEIIAIGNVNGGDPCAGDTLTLLYTNPAQRQLSGTDYLKLIRFIRLWQKLTALWGIDASSAIGLTDNLFSALYPEDQLPAGTGDPANDAANRILLDAGFTTMLLRLGFLLQVMEQLSLTSDALPELLACWADIGTSGDDSLYEELFLTPALQQQDQEAQTVTIAGPMNPGEALTTTINGVPVVYTTVLNDTPDMIGAGVAAAINVCMTVDPVSGLPLNQRFYAANQNGVVTIRTGFTADCYHSSGATEVLEVTSANPVAQTINVAATAITPGDQLTITLNGIPLSVTVGSGDSTATLAASLATLISQTTAQDPYSGEPLNDVVLAASSGSQITLAGANAGTPFDLLCSASSPSSQYVAGAYSYGGAATLTVGGAVSAGDTFRIAIKGWGGINGNLTYIAKAEDADLDVLAANLVTALLDGPTFGPYTNWDGMSASQIGEQILLNLPNLQGYDLTCTVVSSSGATFTSTTPVPPHGTATVVGNVPPLAVLTTIIQGVSMAYTVTATDTPESIAANIAALFAGKVSRVTVSSDANQVIAALSQWWPLPVTVVCSESTIGTFTAGTLAPAQWILQLDGIPENGETVTTIIDGIKVPYTLNFVDAESNAGWSGGICRLINGTTTMDAASGLPLNQTVIARPGPFVGLQSSIVVLGVDAGTNFSVEASASPTAGFLYFYTVSGPFNATQAVTITDPIPASTVLTVILNGINFAHTVKAGETAIELAAAFVTQINQTGKTDPATGLPIPQLLTATSNGGTLTLTANHFTTTFRLSLASSAGTFTAGRRRTPFADDGYGNYLSDPDQTVLGYESLLCAACNLSGTEFDLITANLQYDAHTPLTLANVSAIFRRGWLAHTLGLSVLEFLQMQAVTQLDPFAALDPGSGYPVEPPVIRFLHLLNGMNAAGLKPVQALYLMWNDDITGTAAPSTAQVNGLAATLRDDFATVETQFALQSDPDGSIAKGLMTLVYGVAATDFFFGLLNNSLTPSVAYANPPGQATLAQALVDLSSGRLSYDDLGKQLAYAGALDDTTAAALAAAVAVNTADATVNSPAGMTTFTPADMTNISVGSALVIDSGPAQENVQVSAVTASTFMAVTAQAHDGTGTPVAIVDYAPLVAALQQLATRSDALIAPFFATYPELRSFFTAYASSTDTVQARRTALLAGILPPLKTKRKQEQALASITSAVGTDPSFGNLFLQDAALLGAESDSAAAAVADLTALEQGGLSLALYLHNQTAQAPDVLVPAAPLAFSVKTLALGGTPHPGDVLTTTIDGTGVSYTVQASDSLLTTLAASIAADLNDSALSNGMVAMAVGTNLVLACFSTDAAAPAFLVATAATGAGTYGEVASAPVTARWQGCLDAPQDSVYDFSIALDAGAQVMLTIDGAQVLGAQAAQTWSNASAVALTPGALPSFTLTLTSITSAAVTWQSAGTGWQPVAPEYLYGQTPLNHLQGTYVRFLKATALAAALQLTANEIASLWTPADYAVQTTCRQKLAAGMVELTPSSMDNITAGVSLLLDEGEPAQETVNVTGTTAATFIAVTTHVHDGSAKAFTIASAQGTAVDSAWLNLLGAAVRLSSSQQAGLRDVLAALVDFAAMKQALSPADERLLEVFENPAAVLPNGQTALASLTGWAPPSSNALLTHFFGNIDSNHLRSISNFRRVYDAYALVQAYRVSASALITATTNAPSANTVSALQSALRALYAEPDWQTVIQPLNDAMRILQRDALVAYILQQLSDSGTGIDTADDLYPYLLLDTETQPAVRTSRIRLALSSVQLFIERIVRNLEPNLSPADIDPTQWEWMKCYRVWQANREVFLWPENWLYPELRGNESPFFDTMMSSLLQKDITDDSAAEAYLNYLTNLEEVAKLEPCGMYYVPSSTGSDEITYVVARTAGTRRKYYFRQLEAGAWTPWTEVPIDADDHPLTPIVWGGRLFLFWLKILKQMPPKSAGAPAQDGPLNSLHPSDLQQNAANSLAAQTTASVTVQAMLCWTEFYNGKWQPTKTSDSNQPTTIGVFDPSGGNAFENAREMLAIVPGLYGVDAALLEATEDLSAALLLSIEPVDRAYADGTSVRAASPPGLSAALSTSARGFLLHNTHSRPIRFDELTIDGIPIRDVLDPPPAGRLLSPIQASTGGNVTNGTFQAAYMNTMNNNTPSTTAYANTVMGIKWLPRFTQPQPGAASFWTSPFLYEDRKNVFYVTTDMQFAVRRSYFITPGPLGVAGGWIGGSLSTPLLRRQPGAVTSAPSAGGPSLFYRGTPIGAMGAETAMPAVQKAAKETFAK